MADEGHASRSRRMDLNLYLGLPRSPRPRHRDLGSDLALNSLPLHPPSPAPAPAGMSDPVPPLQDNPTPEPAEPVVPDDPSHAPDDGAPPAVVDAPDTPVSGHDELDSGPSPPTLVPAGGSSVQSDNGSLSRQEVLRNPELHFRRMIESNPGLHLRRYFRPSRSERSDSFTHSSLTAEQLMRNIMSSQGVLETTRKHKGRAEGISAEGDEAEAEDTSTSVANFECNICLDLAKDPVVTSCGHLFCWPCLYQWLHLHCDRSECPVCKGEVVDAKITPIYGRGSMEATTEGKSGDDGELGLKIPPRPRGHRFESLRQQLQRPIRFGLGSPTSWSRRILDEEDANLQSILDGARLMVLSRLREGRMQREEGNTESESNTRDMGLPRYNTSDPQINTTSSPPDEIDHGHRPPLYGLASTYGFAALSAADLGRVVWRFESGSSQAGASTSSVNNRDPEPPLTRPPSEATLASDQASASSTLAVIQGDTAVNDATAEPYSAGSSRLLRRRGRSGTHGSLDVDGGELHARKRRRLN